VKFKDVKTEPANCQSTDNEIEVRNTDTMTADDVTDRNQTDSSQNDESAARNNADENGNRSSKRQSKPPKYLEDYYLNDSVKNNMDYCCKLSVVPLTYSEVISSVESIKCQKAMQSEIVTLNENETFEVD